MSDQMYWLTKCTKTKDEQDLQNPYKPFPEYPYFYELRDAWESDSVLLIEKSRTMMLTWLFARLCLHYAMTHTATKVIFWGPDVMACLAGSEVRLSLDTRDVKKASQKVHEWEAKERVIERGAAVTLADAWTSMIADLEARKLSHETIRKYKLLERQMKTYGIERGLTIIAQFDLDMLSRFRATWKDGPRTSSKNLERLRAFFRFAHDRQWIETNPASKIKLPKVSVRPTMPITHEEMVKTLTAAMRYRRRRRWTAS
jgi:hypothetical protein